MNEEPEKKASDAPPPPAPAAGSGLRGLAQRVGSVDGVLRVQSPAGGPTMVVAELPCER